MIARGDRIAVGLSGGKDSFALLWALDHFRRVAPVEFSLVGATVSMGWGADLSPIASFCADLGVEHHIEDTSIGPIVFDSRREQNPCSLCSNMRRGALLALAARLGCNKVALAHHLDDAAETLIMNIMFSGRVTVFRPVTYMSRRRVAVIRPLVYCTESTVSAAAHQLGAPIVPQDCPASGRTYRSSIKGFISSLREKNPRIDESILASMKQLWAHPGGTGRP
jgi:tRNA(Ile)-lysidine synthase TilS/MesJ